DSVIITLKKPGEFTNQRTVIFGVDTNVDAECTYDIGQGARQFTTETGLYHESALGQMTDGLHTVTVECKGSVKRNSQQLSFFIDAVAPNQTVINATSPLCTLQRISATVTSSDNPGGSGLYGFNYTLRKTDGTDRVISSGLLRTEQNQATITFDQQIEANSSYYWKVFAVDKAGNQGLQGDKHVEVYDPASKDCDFTPPIGSMRTKMFDARTEVNVSCADDESGCDDFYKYQYQTALTRCIPSLTENLDTGVSLFENATFCYAVFDLANNNATGQRYVEVKDVPDHCSNGVNDAGETGIDCGGECLACTVSRCGDGIVNAAGEECDGNDFGNILEGCSDLLFEDQFTGGTLRCNADCTLNTRGCTGVSGGVCGDDTINPGETCEPGLFMSMQCTDLYSGATGGAVKCTNCRLNTSACNFPSASCKQDADCETNSCNLQTGLCEQASCDDDIKNGDEGGIDCGGSCTKKCGIDSECESSNDCSSGWCNITETGGICSLASCEDSLLNGNETGVDCGGPCSDRCATGSACRTNEDCVSNYCDIASHSCSNDLDSDDDGIPDECETAWGLNPYDAADSSLDPDNDGLDNMGEYQVAKRFGHTGKCDEASDINDKDSDNDGYPDGEEVSKGYDPTDPNDHPSKDEPCRDCLDKPVSTIAIIFLIMGLVFILSGGGYIGYTTWIRPVQKPLPPGQAQGQQGTGQQKTVLGQPRLVQRPALQPMTKEQLVQRKKLEGERAQLREKMRSSLFSRFKQPAEEKGGLVRLKPIERAKAETQSIEKTPSAEKPQQQNEEDYVDLSSLGKKKELKKKEDIFAQLPTAKDEKGREKPAKDAFSELDKLAKKAKKKEK
ncbi:MAG: hypothetical protein V1743_03110, partial [Nanoarchaeota archaeon]